VDSREKVLGLKSWLLSLNPEDEAQAQQLQILASFSPLFMKALPEDSEEVDRYLKMISWATVKCRSDDAPALGLFELVEGEWQPVEMEVAE
jgi:hypothetical protein